MDAREVRRTQELGYYVLRLLFSFSLSLSLSLVSDMASFHFFLTRVALQYQ
jgi:hypothetical protein